MFRDQYLLLLLDEERAVRAIPRLLPDDRERAPQALDAVRGVLAAARRAARRSADAAARGSRSCSPSPAAAPRAGDASRA